MNIFRKALTVAVAGWLAATCALGAVKVLNLPANHMVYDSHRGLVYVSVPSRAGAMGNTVTAINPALGVISASVFVGSEPNSLGLSDDGKYLYVGIDGAAAVRRVDLASFTAGLQFQLGTDPFFGPLRAEDIEVQPGNPEVIAVSLVRPDVSPRHGGVAIYDHGIRRPNLTQEHTGSNRIEFSPDPSIIYGYNNETTEFGFRKLKVDSQGVTEINVTGDLISGFGSDIKQAAGLIFATSGEVVNPTIPTLLGTFTFSGDFSFPTSVLPEPGKDRVLFLTDGRTIESFRLSTFTPTGSSPLPPETSGTPFDLVRWGTDGLAFRTSDDQVVILSDGQTSTPPPPDGPWLSAPGLPGFEAKVLIDGATQGARESDCVIETLCVSGALAGRPEIFVKVIGPRPNGFLWTQISRFTPAKVEVWLRKTSTSKINYYQLPPVGPEADDVSGLQDRGAFQP